MQNSAKLKKPYPQSKVSLTVSCFRLVLFCSALTACSTSLPVEPTDPAVNESPSALPQPQSSPSPTPSINLSISTTHWVAFPTSDEWNLIGTLINREPFPIGDVLINLHLKGSNISEELTLTTAPIPAQIQPSAEAIFHFTLPDGSVPTDFTLSYSAIRSDSDPATEIQVDILEYRQSWDGRLLILGEVYNQGDHLLHLQSVHIILMDDQEAPLGIAVSEHLLSALPPNKSNPFIASAEAFIEADSWKSYVDASPALMPPISPLEFSTGFTTETTAQGQPYFLGQVENQGVTPWWMVLNIVYLVEDDVLGLDTLELPFPIPPRDRIAFVLDPSQSLPADTLIEVDPDDIEIRIFVDPWKALPSIESLLTIPVAITQFEQIGSKLYLRGEVTNPAAIPVTHAAVIITVYDVQGRTRAVGWSDPLVDLPVGDTQNFKVTLLIPKGLDLTLTEFDVRAFGFPLE